MTTRTDSEKKAATGTKSGSGRSARRSREIGARPAQGDVAGRAGPRVGCRADGVRWSATIAHLAISQGAQVAADAPDVEDDQDAHDRQPDQDHQQAHQSRHVGCGVEAGEVRQRHDEGVLMQVREKAPHGRTPAALNRCALCPLGWAKKERGDSAGGAEDEAPQAVPVACAKMAPAPVYMGLGDRSALCALRLGGGVAPNVGAEFDLGDGLPALLVQEPHQRAVDLRLGAQSLAQVADGRAATLGVGGLVVRREGR